MKGKFKTIDYDWLTRPTGDPFADTGAYVIQYFWEKFPDKDIDWLIEYVTKIYVNDWEKTIYFFFPNSPMINSLSKKPVENTLQSYLKIINDNDSEEDYCRVTGRRTKVFKTFKDKYILAGSGKFSNFHHSFDNGILLSKEIIIRSLFIPIGVLKIGKYIGLVHSNNNVVMKFIVQNNAKTNLNNIAFGDSKEIAENTHNIATNSIFSYANLCIDNLAVARDETKNISLTLYHFTNYNQGPALDLYQLPAKVFSVYRYFELKHRIEWKTFVNRHYLKKEAKFDRFEECFKIEKKSSTEIFNYEDYSKWKNSILNKLLNNESITPEFKTWSKNGNKLHFDIVRIYLQNIRNMKKETIDKLLELADFIINDRSEDEIKKLITRLNGASKAHELRRFLLSLVSENYNKDNDQPLITVKDYTDYLFSDSGNTGELRDVLLIAIYQKMHELNLKLELPEEMPEKIEQ
jgi:CRISPR-associated protein Cst1